MNKVISCFFWCLLLSPFISGCLSSAPDAPTNWLVDHARCVKPVATAASSATTVRLLSLDVRAPFSGQRLTVLRPDGSVAFDDFNTFAAPPSQLLTAAAVDALAASGRFAHVAPPGSSAKTDYSLELTVTDFALDCREAGVRKATAALNLLVLKGREVVVLVHGAGSQDITGDFSADFSTAFERALQDALAKLTLP